MPAKGSSRRHPLGRTLALLLGGVALLIAGANFYVVQANQSRLYTAVDEVPACDVALVLGTSPAVRGGQPNLHFLGRIEAAAALYHAGRTKHLLVSGDNRQANYNEPVMMRAALVRRGVPAEAITCDYAGFRTLDSVVRAREVFELKRCIIVTQRYHNPRALEIARANGLEAYGFCPADVGFGDSFKTECREVLARVVTVFDLYVWHRSPHFLGKAEPIKVATP